MTCTVSLHPFTVHINPYVPAVVKPDTVVVGDVALVKVTVAGFPALAVHEPFPVAAMTVEVFWQMVWLGPPFGFGVTITLAVSVQPFDVHM